LVETEWVSDRERKLTNLQFFRAANADRRGHGRCALQTDDGQIIIACETRDLSL
jgi:hypothetical protein